MSNDPFDVLVLAARRDRTWDEPVDLEADARAAAILQRVRAGAVVVTLGQRRRRRLIVGTIAVGAIALGSTVAVAAANWTRRTPSTVRALACWNHAPLGDDGAIIGTRFVRGEAPDVTCARLWTDPQYADVHPPQPPFVTCVADYGTAVVIPGADETACDRGGLERFDGHIVEEVWDIAEVEDEMTDLVLGGVCMDTATATATVREALDRHGLDDWTITETPAENPALDVCAIFGFDEQTETATIVHLPKEPT